MHLFKRGFTIQHHKDGIPVKLTRKREGREGTEGHTKTEKTEDCEEGMRADKERNP